MTYRPIDTAPRDIQVSVLTRAYNVRTCWFDADGMARYRNVHGQWHDTVFDPPTHWWDGPFPGAPTGRIKPPKCPKFYPI